MEILDHDGGPVVRATPELGIRLAEAVDGPTRRRARLLEVVLVVLAAAAAVLVALSHGRVSWWLAVTPLAMAAILYAADLGRRRTVRRAIGAQERFALRYDAAARLVRFPLTGSEHPLGRFRRAELHDGIIVLHRKDGTRTPLPADAIADDQRDALLAALAR